MMPIPSLMKLLIPTLVLSIPTLSDEDVLVSQSDIVGIAEPEIGVVGSATPISSSAIPTMSDRDTKTLASLKSRSTTKSGSATLLMSWDRQYFYSQVGTQDIGII